MSCADRRERFLRSFKIYIILNTYNFLEFTAGFLIGGRGEVKLHAQSPDKDETSGTIFPHVWKMDFNQTLAPGEKLQWTRMTALNNRR